MALRNWCFFLVGFFHSKGDNIFSHCLQTQFEWADEELLSLQGNDAIRGNTVESNKEENILELIHCEQDSSQ